MKKKIPLKKEQAKRKSAPEIKKDLPLVNFLFLSFIILLPVVFFVFGPCLKNGFSNWDDPTYIENNPLIKSFSFLNIKKIFTEIYFSNYHPLHIFSYLIEYHFFKLNPFGYHMVSIIMHAMVTLVVMWFVLGISENKLISIITGILFAIHPMHVESVAWAAERKDLLYSFFFFSSLVAYLYYLKNKEKTLNYILCLLFFTLAIFSKAMAASLPPVLVLIDMYYKRKISWRTVAEKIPFFILALILGLVSVYASNRDGSIDTNKTYAFLDRIFLANANLLLYMAKLLAPFHLSPYYPYPDKINGSLPWLYYFSPLGVALLVVIALYTIKLNRILFFSFGFFTLTVFLVLQLLPVGPTIFSERYSYIPSATFFMLIAYAFHFLHESKNKNRIFQYLLFTGFIAYCSWLSLITFERCKIWKDPDTFWTDVITKFDNVPIAYNNRGHYYNKTGKKTEALADFNKAISLNSTYDLARFNRGSLLGEMGKFNEALEDLNLALKENKKLPEAYKMRGQVYAVTGKGDSALADFKKVLELQPDYPEIYFNLGIFYLNSGNKEEACKNFNIADKQHFEKAKEAVEKYCK